VTSAAEHLPNDPDSELWGEHRARYRFAADYVAGRRVVDVACGAGFGLELLEDAGARALGIDLDVHALSDARGTRPRAQLVRSDAACLPLGDGAIDVVVSLETIEHVPDAVALVAEYRRVLHPQGTLVLSTPNREFGPERLHTQNPFHVREFTATELRALLREHFGDVHLFGQFQSAAYRYVPFLMTEPHREAKAILWKAQNRLPARPREALARTVSGRSFYPSESDYEFVADRVDGSHGLVAVATGGTQYSVLSTQYSAAP
jgi:SAM-dependent methyltransferase